MSGKIILGSVFLFLFPFYIVAIVPLDALLLGDLDERYDPGLMDAYRDIFIQDEDPKIISDKNIREKRVLALARGFYQEGKNLKLFCETNNDIQYPTDWDEVRAKRSVLATFQYLGLDITMQFLVKYVRELEFSDDEFGNFADGLIGNYCSKNISFISTKNLRKWFQARYHDYDPEADYNIPNLSGNKYFSGIKTFDGCTDCLKNEFFVAIDLFRSFCSWGGKTKNLRLMTHLVRNPVIYSFLVRRMTMKMLDWEQHNNAIFKRPMEDMAAVVCRDLICRLTTKKSKFEKRMPHGLGGKDLEDDFKRIYCEHFQNVQFETANEPHVIKKWIEEMNDDHVGYQESLFISFLTGIPDFLLRGHGLIQGEELLSGSFDFLWKRWGYSKLGKFGMDLYYEESLTIETVDRKLFFDRTLPRFKVMFDVNMGEFDRVNQMVGKVAVKFNVEISKSLLAWFRAKWYAFDPSDKLVTYTRDDLVHLFARHLVPQIEKSRSSFRIPPWQTGLERLVAKELLQQVAMYSGRFFKGDRHEKIKVPVQFNYAPFALKYIRHRFLTGKKSGRKD